MLQVDKCIANPTERAREREREMMWSGSGQAHQSTVQCTDQDSAIRASGTSGTSGHQAHIAQALVRLRQAHKGIAHGHHQYLGCMSKIMQANGQALNKSIAHCTDQWDRHHQYHEHHHTFDDHDDADVMTLTMR